MRITGARVFVGGPGKNYVTLKIETDVGVHGLGDATLNNRETLPAAYLRDYVVPNLVGMDPRRSEDIWQFLYRGAYFRRGPVAMAAFGAVDMALWDIKGKLAGMPVCDLLGGRSREGAMVYGHAAGADLEDLMDSVASHVERGYRAVRVQCAVPGMAGYAVPEARGGAGDFITDFGGIRSKVEAWDTGRYMRFMPGALAEIRARFGPELHILHDVHHRLLPREAAEFARAVEPVGLFWLEDPTPAEDQDALRIIRQHSTVPLAIGEVFNSIWDCNRLIEREQIDFIRVAATYAGGITHVRRIVDLAALHHVRTGFHGAPSHSPICMAAHAHLDVWAPNFGIQEWLVLGTPACDALFPTEHRVEDGMLRVSDAPGLGVEFDEREAARYEYRPGSHPVVRLGDGTLWNY
ncbi:D-mannonate dehydratase ManD [Jannaschia sp. W003]|uniref:D-mannonate dehydratase ManD n=1 Tax=Jannaschia sp. W003 TaxID=2867012 RepID=UPI0021A746D8|nr:D-mannonate dehydratase ManD [Jannaschia sp. W003]UWQ22442.1 D-galactonate dehydratase family protein [Jannaschia sp. W003]